MLALAKALIEAEWRPDRPVWFVSHTADGTHAPADNRACLARGAAGAQALGARHRL
jgi:hypothetical protein